MNKYEKELHEIDARIEQILWNIIDDIGNLDECDITHPLRRSLNMATDMIEGYEKHIDWPPEGE